MSKWRASCCRSSQYWPVMLVRFLVNHQRDHRFASLGCIWAPHHVIPPESQARASDHHVVGATFSFTGGRSSAGCKLARSLASDHFSRSSRQTRIVCKYRRAKLSFRKLALINVAFSIRSIKVKKKKTASNLWLNVRMDTFLFVARKEVFLVRILQIAGGKSEELSKFAQTCAGIIEKIPSFPRKHFRQ